MPILEYPNIIELVFHHLGFWINSSWNLGGNCLICRKCILLFHILLDACKWLITLAVFSPWTSRKKGSILDAMLLYGFIRYYWNIFFGWHWYSTMNATTMLWFFDSVCIKRRIVLWSSILLILPTVIILWRLMKWPLLLSTIILGGTGFFLWTPILF